MVRHCVWSRNLVNDEALAHWGAVSPETNKQTLIRVQIMELTSVKIFSILSLFSLMLAKYSPHKFVVCVSCNIIRLYTNKIALKFTLLKQHIKMIVLF